MAIYSYVTKGTFGAYHWSIVENKQKFISQIMTSKPIGRSCTDIDESVLNFAEIKAVATDAYDKQLFLQYIRRKKCLTFYIKTMFDIIIKKAEKMRHQKKT